jgi:PadR family transcriptional regulator, regulatory protein PadR
MSPGPRFSAQTRLIIEALLTGPAEWRYGYDLSRETDLKSGTLYPILMRLAEHKVVESCWEPSSEEGRPPRHMYRLTGEGAKWARQMVPESTRKGVLRPAASEGGAR